MAKHILARQSKQTCYVKAGDQTRIEPLYQLCGGNQNSDTFCCLNNHICLEQGICYSNEDHSGTSGYYVGGCTDISFGAPARTKSCSSYSKTDIVNNPSSGFWTCCSGGDTAPGLETDCDHPGNESFQAKPISALSTAPKYTPPGTPSTTVIANAPASSNPSSSSATASSPAGSASPSAAAGYSPSSSSSPSAAAASSTSSFTPGSSSSEKASSTLSDQSSGAGATTTIIVTNNAGSPSALIIYPSNTSSPSTSGSNAQNSGGLSTGAKAGIGIGASVGAIALIVMIIFLLIGRRSQKDKSVTAVNGSGGYNAHNDIGGGHYEKEVLDMKPKFAAEMPAKYYSDYHHAELDGTGRNFEADGAGRSELWAGVKSAYR